MRIKVRVFVTELPDYWSSGLVAISPSGEDVFSSAVQAGETMILKNHYALPSETVASGARETARCGSR